MSKEQWKQVLERAFAQFDGRASYEKKWGVSGVISVQVAGARLKTKYGGLKEEAICACFTAVVDLSNIANISPKTRFVDLGSGIGQIAMQIHACTRAHSTGVELAPSRHKHAMALAYYMHYFGKALKGPIPFLNLEWDSQGPSPFQLLEGNFTDPKLFKSSVASADVIFFNNYGHWFSGRRDFTADVEGELEQLLQQQKCKGKTLITMQELADPPQPWMQGMCCSLTFPLPDCLFISFHFFPRYFFCSLHFACCYSTSPAISSARSMMSKNVHQNAKLCLPINAAGHLMTGPTTFISIGCDVCQIYGQK
ncbi:unnamed protein product [Chrysoparadoxa australica]